MFWGFFIGLDICLATETERMGGYRDERRLSQYYLYYLRRNTIG